MSFARNILRDLVEKRLWPVALLMVVAIVAIPVLGGGSSSSSSETALPIAPADADNASSAVALLGPASVRKRAGKVVDPFRRAKKKQAAKVTQPGTQEAAGGATGGTTTTTTTPAPSLSVYRTSVRFGPAGDFAKVRQISRLTPLGELLNPALMYIGVAAGGKHALFLLGPDATSVGEGRCRAGCRVIALASGESQVVDLSPLGAAAQQFELELVSIKRAKLASAAKAAKARAFVHIDGPDVLRLIAEDRATLAAISAFAYDRGRGVVVQTGS